MKEAVKKAQKGDKEAFTQIINMVKVEAYRIAFSYLQHEQDSTDALLSSIEKAYRNLRQLRKPELFKTWFIRILINECKQILKKRNHLLYIEDLSMELQEEVSFEENIDFKDVFSKLNDNEQYLLRLKYGMGYSFREISKITGLPEGTIKTNLYRSIKRLKNNLDVVEGW